MWLGCYMYNYYGERTDTGLCAIMINPPELPNNDEARNETHIVRTVCDETGN